MILMFFFAAHEVRNPLSAALSASSFVSAAINDKCQGHAPRIDLTTDGKGECTVQEDLRVVSSSLQFINDLLRNILDSHKAMKGQLQIEMKTSCLRKDVFEPVAAMIYKRDYQFDVQIDCAESLILRTDPIRLKQVVLNLANNSCKFVRHGYVRIGASVDKDDHVSVYVEDSGPGIDPDKRNNLFDKFQTSLDELSQGTGVGLSLCKELTRLMGAEIELDESFQSGIDSCPGSRFVIHLNQKAQRPVEKSHQVLLEDGSTSQTDNKLPELPLNLRILFVDDDNILRRLFCRSVKRVAPTWQIEEATNGETSVRYIEEQVDRFDIIFVSPRQPLIA